jgi:hypothetical protein
MRAQPCQTPAWTLVPENAATELASGLHCEVAPEASESTPAAMVKSDRYPDVSN